MAHFQRLFVNISSWWFIKRLAARSDLWPRTPGPVACPLENPACPRCSKGCHKSPACRLLVAACRLLAVVSIWFKLRKMRVIAGTDDWMSPCIRRRCRRSRSHRRRWLMAASPDPSRRRPQDLKFLIWFHLCIFRPHSPGLTVVIMSALLCEKLSFSFWELSSLFSSKLVPHYFGLLPRDGVGLHLDLLLLEVDSGRCFRFPFRGWLALTKWKCPEGLAKSPKRKWWQAKTYTNW